MVVVCVILALLVVVLASILLVIKLDINNSNVGDFVVIRDDDGKTIISLELHEDAGNVEDKDRIWFTVKKRIAN